MNAAHVCSARGLGTGWLDLRVLGTAVACLQCSWPGNWMAGLKGIGDCCCMSKEASRLGLM